MKKRFIISATVIAVLFLFAFPFVFTQSKESKSTVYKSNTALNEISTTEAQSYLYLLKIYDEKIGVFRPNESSPYTIIDTNTDDLPDTDKELLSKGIALYSDSELQKAIEDYTS
ncbi:MAG: hypothetical protein K5917_07060 [Clostridiales bacterium]|nr:hypothetical protein [Clostridiales bacterium]